MKKAPTKAKKSPAKPSAHVVGDRPDIASRVAWSYLGAVLAAVVGGLLALVAYQVARPLACPPVSGEEGEFALTCQLAWAAGLAAVGFVAAYAGALAILKVERWVGLLLGTAAGLLGLLMLVGNALQWWWWAALLLLPAAACLASAPWSPSRTIQRVQLGVLALAALVAVGGFALSIVPA